MQLVKKKKGKKRPGYRGDDAARSSEGTSGGRADPGGSPRGDGPARGGGDGGDRREQRSVATTLGISPTTQSDLGVDRSAVDQFSQFGRNVLAKNLDPRLRFDPRTGGMKRSFLGGLGSNIFGGILSLINPALGLAFRGINFMRDKVPETFQNFQSSNTLEEFRDKMRGYGRTIPNVSKRPFFGGIESLGTFEEDEEDPITGGITETGVFNNSPYGNSQTLAGDDFLNNAMAAVSKQDLARYSQQKDLINQQDYESAMDTIFKGSQMTPYEFDQLKKGNITQPGTYTKIG
tara:strand:+ start:27 stop:896 length:870 start_codon:yes stop_codon:yes gene_type:complete